jgi:hypothetical protein
LQKAVATDAFRALHETDPRPLPIRTAFGQKESKRGLLLRRIVGLYFRARLRQTWRGNDIAGARDRAAFGRQSGYGG